MATLVVTRGLDPWWLFPIRVGTPVDRSVSIHHGTKEVVISSGSTLIQAEMFGWNALPVALDVAVNDVYHVRVGVDWRRALSPVNHFRQSVALSLSVAAA